MRKIILIFILSATFPAWAGTNQVHIISTDPYLNLKGTRFQQASAPKSKLLSTGLRDQIFKEAGLESDVKNMDQLERDMLFIRARTKALTELQELYPGISSQKLTLFKNLLQ